MTSSPLFRLRFSVSFSPLRNHRCIFSFLSSSMSKCNPIIAAGSSPLRLRRSLCHALSLRRSLSLRHSLSLCDGLYATFSLRRSLCDVLSATLTLRRSLFVDLASSLSLFVIVFVHDSISLWFDSVAIHSSLGDSIRLSPCQNLLGS